MSARTKIKEAKVDMSIAVLRSVVQKKETNILENDRLSNKPHHQKLIRAMKESIQNMIDD